MKKYFLLIIVTCLFGYNTFAQESPNHKEIINLSAARFKVLIDKETNLDGRLIDLRTTDEMSKGFIKGATQIDFLAKDAEKQLDNLDKTKIYYVYCAGGGRSGQAAEYMAEHGFTRIYNLEKGFSEWKQKDFPIEKK